MADYRAYVIGGDGHFVRVIPLDCPDDSEAIEATKQYIDGHDIELWLRDRLIVKFDRKPQES